MSNEPKSKTELIKFDDSTSEWVVEPYSEEEKFAIKIKEIIFRDSSSFQTIELYDTYALGKVLFLDGAIQMAEYDEFVYHESLCHPALIHHPNPERVCILGGGECFTAREVLKHKSVKYVCMADIDEMVIDVCRKHLHDDQEVFADPRLEIIIGDAAEVLEKQGKFDVIIADLPDPFAGGPCFELYTKEFYQNLMENNLTEEGIFVTQSYTLELEKEENEVFTAIHNTLEKVFPQVIPYKVQIPSFLGDCGFNLGFKSPRKLIDCITFDHRLESKIKGDLEYIDGEVWSGMTKLNKILRKGLDEETKIYTKEQPPNLILGEQMSAFSTTKATNESSSLPVFSAEINRQREIIQSVWEAEIKRVKELEKHEGNIVFDLCSLEHPFFLKYELKPKDSELGIFATKDLKAGEIVSLLPIRFIPTSISDISLKIAPSHFVNWNIDTHSYNEYSSPDGDYCQCCILEDFINHACYPDCNVTHRAVHYLSDSNRMAYELIAIKDIKVGEEILIDYDTFIYIDNPMKCKCNSSQCRKIIKGFKYLSKTTQKLFFDKNLISTDFAAHIYSNLPIALFHDQLALFSDENYLSAEEKIHFDTLVDIMYHQEIIIL